MSTTDLETADACYSAIIDECVEGLKGLLEIEGTVMNQAHKSTQRHQMLKDSSALIAKWAQRLELSL